MRGWAVTKALPMLLFELTDGVGAVDGPAWPPGTVFPSLASYWSRGRVRLRGRAVWLAPQPVVPWASSGRLDAAFGVVWGRSASGRLGACVGRPVKASGSAVALCGRVGVAKGLMGRPTRLLDVRGRFLVGRAARSRGWVRRRDETAILLALLD